MLEITELISNIGSTVIVIGLIGVLISGLSYLILKEVIEEPSKVIDNFKTGFGFSALCTVAGVIIEALVLLIWLIVDIWK